MTAPSSYSSINIILHIKENYIVHGKPKFLCMKIRHFPHLLKIENELGMKFHLVGNFEIIVTLPIEWISNDIVFEMYNFKGLLGVCSIYF